MKDADFRDVEGEHVFGGSNLAKVKKHKGVLTIHCDCEVGLEGHVAGSLGFREGFGGRKGER